MRNVFIFFAFLIAGMAQAQIITNVDKLRIRDVEQGVESDKILVIDSGNVVRWIDAIEVDLSDYYTISEVDAFVSDLGAGLLDRYTKSEVDALLDGLELRLDDYYTKTEVDSIITNINDRIDNIDLNTVTSVDNVTSIKIRGSSIFTNNLETDFAQIADVNKAGFGLISMQSEMKIGLVAKDGTTLIDDVDVSWLASGDLAVTIDDTDSNNPELVFSQNGVEIARIPASTLLSGVARSANLSNYILQFKDGTGAVVYSVNLEPLFEDYYTKTEANARYALSARTITAGTGLTGGGNLTANRTIALSATSVSDIAKGVTAYGWGNHAGKYFGAIGSNVNDLDDVPRGTAMKADYPTSTSAGFRSHGSGITLGYSDDLKTQLWINNNGIVQSKSFIDSIVRTMWDDFNLPNPATEGWSDDRFSLKSHTHSISDVTGLQSALNSKEDSFSKNTAFNSNFGTTSNTVAQGNDSRINNGQTAFLNYAERGESNNPRSLRTNDTRAVDELPSTNLQSEIRGDYKNGNIFGLATTDRQGVLTVVPWIDDSGNNDTAFRLIQRQGILRMQYYNSGSWRAPVTILNNSNILSYNFTTLPLVQTWVNNQGFLNSNALNNYYTKTEALNQFVGLSGVQDIADTKTFLNSPVVPNPTLDAHAVNKEYVDNRSARVDFNYSYTSNANVNAKLDDFTVVINDLEGFSINSGGDISLGEGVYLLSLYVRNSAFPSGSGFTAITSNIGGNAEVIMDSYVKYGGNSTKIIVIPTNINNGRIHLTKQNMENLQGVATLSIVKIK